MISHTTKEMTMLSKSQLNIVLLRENLYKFKEFLQFLACQGPFSLGYDVFHMSFFFFFFAEVPQEEKQTPQVLGELFLIQSTYLDFV